MAGFRGFWLPPLTKWIQQNLITCQAPCIMTCQSQRTAANPANPEPSWAHVQYITGPECNWTCDDGLYHWFQTWKIKCGFILNGDLESLAEECKCKTLLWWSGDTGLEQYQSWGIADKDLTLQTIWDKFEEHGKPKQMNLELTMTYSKSSNKPASAVTSSLLPYKTSCHCVSTLQKHATSLKEIFSCLASLTKCSCQKSSADGENLTTAEIW